MKQRLSSALKSHWNRLDESQELELSLDDRSFFPDGDELRKQVLESSQRYQARKAAASAADSKENAQSNSPASTVSVGASCGTWVTFDAGTTALPARQPVPKLHVPLPPTPTAATPSPHPQRRPNSHRDALPSPLTPANTPATTPATGAATFPVQFSSGGSYPSLPPTPASAGSQRAKHAALSSNAGLAVRRAAEAASPAAAMVDTPSAAASPGTMSHLSSPSSMSDGSWWNPGLGPNQTPSGFSAETLPRLEVPSARSSPDGMTDQATPLSSTGAERTPMSAASLSNGHPILQQLPRRHSVGSTHSNASRRLQSMHSMPGLSNQGIGSAFADIDPVAIELPLPAPKSMRLSRMGSTASTTTVASLPDADTDVAASTSLSASAGIRSAQADASHSEAGASGAAPHVLPELISAGLLRVQLPDAAQGEGTSSPAAAASTRPLPAELALQRARQDAAKAIAAARRGPPSRQNSSLSRQADAQQSPGIVNAAVTSSSPSLPAALPTKLLSPPPEPTAAAIETAAHCLEAASPLMRLPSLPGSSAAAANATFTPAAVSASTLPPLPASPNAAAGAAMELPDAASFAALLSSAESPAAAADHAGTLPAELACSSHLPSLPSSPTAIATAASKLDASCNLDRSMQPLAGSFAGADAAVQMEQIQAAIASATSPEPAALRSTTQLDAPCEADGSSAPPIPRRMQLPDIPAAEPPEYAAKHTPAADSITEEAQLQQSSRAKAALPDIPDPASECGSCAQPMADLGPSSLGTPERGMATSTSSPRLAPAAAAASILAMLQTPKSSRATSPARSSASSSPGSAPPSAGFSSDHGAGFGSDIGAFGATSNDDSPTALDLVGASGTKETSQLMPAAASQESSSRLPEVSRTALPSIDAQDSPLPDAVKPSTLSPATPAIPRSAVPERLLPHGKGKPPASARLLDLLRSPGADLSSPAQHSAAHGAAQGTPCTPSMLGMAARQSTLSTPDSTASASRIMEMLRSPAAELPPSSYSAPSKLMRSDREAVDAAPVVIPETGSASMDQAGLAAATAGSGEHAAGLLGSLGSKDFDLQDPLQTLLEHPAPAAAPQVTATASSTPSSDSSEQPAQDSVRFALPELPSGLSPGEPASSPLHGAALVSLADEASVSSWSGDAAVSMPLEAPALACPVAQTNDTQASPPAAAAAAEAVATATAHAFGGVAATGSAASRAAAFVCQSAAEFKDSSIPPAFSLESAGSASPRPQPAPAAPQQAQHAKQQAQRLAHEAQRMVQLRQRATEGVQLREATQEATPEGLLMSRAAHGSPKLPLLAQAAPVDSQVPLRAVPLRAQLPQAAQPPAQVQEPLTADEIEAQAPQAQRAQQGSGPPPLLAAEVSHDRLSSHPVSAAASPIDTTGSLRSPPQDRPAAYAVDSTGSLTSPFCGSPAATTAVGHSGETARIPASAERSPVPRLALGLLAEADRLANGTPASTSQNIDLVGHPIAGWSSAGSSAASSAERPGARPVSAEDDISTESAAIIASARVHRTLFPSPHAQSMDSAEQPGATSISDMLAPRGSRSASPAAAEHVLSGRADRQRPAHADADRDQQQLDDRRQSVYINPDFGSEDAAAAPQPPLQAQQQQRERGAAKLKRGHGEPGQRAQLAQRSPRMHSNAGFDMDLDGPEAGGQRGGSLADQAAEPGDNGSRAYYNLQYGLDSPRKPNPADAQQPAAASTRSRRQQAFDKLHSNQGYDMEAYQAASPEPLPRGRSAAKPPPSPPRVHDNSAYALLGLKRPDASRSPPQQAQRAQQRRAARQRSQGATQMFSNSQYTVDGAGEPSESGLLQSNEAFDLPAAAASPRREQLDADQPLRSPQRQQAQQAQQALSPSQQMRKGALRAAQMYLNSQFTTSPSKSAGASPSKGGQEPFHSSPGTRRNSAYSEGQHPAAAPANDPDQQQRYTVLRQPFGFKQMHTNAEYGSPDSPERAQQRARRLQRAASEGAPASSDRTALDRGLRSGVSEGAYVRSNEAFNLPAHAEPAGIRRSLSERAQRTQQQQEDEERCAAIKQPMGYRDCKDNPAFDKPQPSPRASPREVDPAKGKSRWRLPLRLKSNEVYEASPATVISSSGF